MRKPIQITIPQPCHEKWDEMTPTDKGRFCASCQKNVIDFTKASDRQIANTLNGNKSLCGRFSSSQLNRNLVVPKEKSTFWSAIAAMVISFISFGCNNKTQESKNSKLPSTIKITVKDEDSTLKDAFVINKTKKIRTSVNKRGVYEIEASKNDTIEIVANDHYNEGFNITKVKDTTVILTKRNQYITGIFMPTSIDE